MDTPVLYDKNIFPDDIVLKKYLGSTKKIYDSFITFLSEKNKECIIEWNYYNDGKSWLCKVVKKKKTICWISIWNKYFKVGFYFGLKYDEEIRKLNINEMLKKKYFETKTIGKIRPLGIKVTESGQLHDIKKIIEFKEKLK
jgi:hypothetical protein